MSNDLDWNSKIDLLFKSKTSKNLAKLKAANIHHLSDLLWIFPLKVNILPKLNNFQNALEGTLFQGKGEVISFISRPNFKQKGKGNTTLENITMTVRDINGNILQLKWFNNYPSQVGKLKSIKNIHFWGEVTAFQDTLQIVNPTIIEDNTEYSEDSLIITYPTINGVGPSHLKKMINKIPIEVWDSIEETLPINIIEKRELTPLKDSFKKIHGKFSKISNWKEASIEKAKDRLIYEEFFNEQLKVLIRKNHYKQPLSKAYSIDSNKYQELLNFFPYELTKEQKKVTDEVLCDLNSSAPMMRLIQGDVGCGKTTIAQIASYVTIKNNMQVAIMCPTEALAQQHFQGFNELFEKNNIKIELILGSTKASEKKRIKQEIESGKIDLIIGTHSLIQDDVKFKNLQLSIIDEQHKFGVEQRIALTSKSEGSNCLIMTATPIPRSLSLTHYGDLDISTIKELPSGRKSIKTRIVTESTFEKFLSFLKTRLTMKEQAYLVVPAINESTELDINNLETVVKRFKNFFPEFKLAALHGQMKADEKRLVFNQFKNKEIDLLLSTSVVEVGLNVPNATIMSILNPERFGLSSIHQLRGRIGRGDKPGFCFLVLDKKVSNDSLNRLKVIENNTDGFQIAEEDLKFRGEGNLFGKEQSGSNSNRKLANIITHKHILEQVRSDIDELKENNPEELNTHINYLNKEKIIYSTV